LLPAAGVCALLAPLADKSAPEPAPPALTAGESWREKLWLVPDDTRLGVRELSEALGRPVSWVYRRTAPRSSKALLPHRVLDGRLTFVVAEVRRFLECHEIKGTA
jgi:hypothetical protein